MRILVVEDDRESASWLIKGLTEAGHVADHARDGPEGVALARERVHDVVVMDRMLPQLDGLAAIRTMRAEGINTPVLILSALSDVDEKVKGLRAGGDDYLAKPYAFTELLARVETLARTAQRAGKPILLQPREFKLLEYLMRNAGNVVTRTMLLENVWDYHFDPQTNVIDVHISRLRSKIDKGFGEPLLHTVRGAGYTIRAS